MAYLEVLKEHLVKEKGDLAMKIRQEEEIRDSAPSAMESHSDTTRHRYEESLRNLKNKLHELDASLNNLPDVVQADGKVSLWDSVALETNDMKKEFVLVPEGLGGKKLLNGATLLSVNSPLGQVLVNKKLGDKVNFGQNQAIIVALEG